MHPARLSHLAYKHKQSRAVVAMDERLDGTHLFLDCGHEVTIAPHFDARHTHYIGCAACGELYVKSAPQYANEFAASAA